MPFRRDPVILVDAVRLRERLQDIEAAVEQANLLLLRAEQVCGDRPPAWLRDALDARLGIYRLVVAYRDLVSAVQNRPTVPDGRVAVPRREYRALVTPVFDLRFVLNSLP